MVVRRVEAYHDVASGQLPLYREFLRTLPIVVEKHGTRRSFSQEMYACFLRDHYASTARGGPWLVEFKFKAVIYKAEGNGADVLSEDWRLRPLTTSEQDTTGGDDELCHDLMALCYERA